MGNTTESTWIPAVSDVDIRSDQVFIVILGVFFVVFWCILLAYTVVASTLNEMADWAHRRSLAEMQLSEAGDGFRADGMLDNEDADELTDPPLLRCVMHNSADTHTHTYMPVIDHQVTSCNKGLSGGGGEGMGGGARPTTSPMCARHTTHTIPPTTVNNTESAKSPLAFWSSPATASSALPCPMHALPLACAQIAVPFSHQSA